MKKGILLVASISFLLLLSCETDYEKVWSIEGTLNIISKPHKNVHGLEVVDLVWADMMNPDDGGGDFYENIGSQQVWEAFDPEGKISIKERGERFQQAVKMKYKIMCQKTPITVSVVSFESIPFPK